MKKTLKIGLFAVFILFHIINVNALLFSGYTYNSSGGALNATNVTIEIWNDETSEPILNTSYSNLSNASGYWTVTVSDTLLVEGKSIKFVPRHYNGTYVDYIGATLPPFPQDAITNELNTSAIDFYLKEGATINITAINSSGGAVNFTYMIKDTKLGFPIESEWTNPVTNKTIYVPADRNYSVEIFPTQAMPVYYDLSNLSNYSAPKKVDIIFNTTTQSVRVTGRFNLSNGTGVFDSIDIINYLLEPGAMVFYGEAMPYNMSAWDSKTDNYSAINGEYNITLQGTTMASNVLMFAIAKSGSEYYGAFRNISPTITGGDIMGFNFTLYRLVGSPGNITVNNGLGGKTNISVSKTTFNFVNASNASLTSATAHLEVELAYSNVNSQFPDFTWMIDVQQSDQGSFAIPFLNYSIKKMNMLTQSYAPLKLKYTAAQLNASQINITLRQFNPGGIDSDFGGIQMKMLKSSAECDVPSPPSSCDLSGSSDSKNETDFKPLNSVISGGKISLRIEKGSIVVHYKNVDMIASGPPDAAFDQSATSSSSGSSTEEIWRFGSLGPEIYTSLLVGFPYSGVDDSYDINISLPYLYDNNWNIAWNTSANGTTGITTNLTDYADYNESWFAGMNCSKTDITSNCFVNTTSNMVWIQLPHFSGVGPSSKGRTSSSSGGSSGGGGGGGVTNYQCDDDLDNDGDSLVDYDGKGNASLIDPGCDSKYDNDEYNCLQRFLCAEWSSCAEEGKQTRTCVDKNKCDSPVATKTEEQSCTYIAPVAEPQPPTASGTTIGEIKENDGLNWKWSGAIWLKEGTAEYDQIQLAVKEEIPPEKPTIAEPPKATIAWLYWSLALAVLAIIAIVSVFAKKKK